MSEQRAHGYLLELIATQRALVRTLHRAFGPFELGSFNLPNAGSITEGGSTWAFRRHGAGVQFSEVSGRRQIDVPDLTCDEETIDGWRLTTHLGALGRTGEKLIQGAIGDVRGSMGARVQSWLDSLVSRGALVRCENAYKLPVAAGRAVSLTEGSQQGEGSMPFGARRGQQGGGQLVVFAGSSSANLTARICAHLDIAVGCSESFRFAEGNTFVRILENVRGRDAYIVQTTVFPANDSFMELLFYVDALKRASAASVTAVIPYFSYAKGDKKDEPRVSIRARVCADALQVAGIDRVITVDLHAAQIQGFFSVPVDNLTAGPILVDRLRREELEDIVIVAADAGFAKDARRFASYLGVPVAIADKRRVAHDDRAEVLGVLGDVSGRIAVIVDDFAISCRTMVGNAGHLLEMGATEVYAAITHGVFSADAAARLDDSPIRKIFVTDTIETHPVPLSRRVETVSVAGLLGEAIRRVHCGESVSQIFDWRSPRG